MTLPVSPHHPIHAGAEETITGSLAVNTGLRDLQSFSVSLGEAASANSAFVYAIKSIVGGEAVLTIYVQAATYAASSTATKVRWTALGK